MSESTERKHQNVFKFGLYRIDKANGVIVDTDTVMERIFSADSFNPVVRYSVDIREKISGIISKLSKTLSRKNLSYNIQGYNNLTWYSDTIKSYHKKRVLVPSKLQQPENVKFSKGTQEFYGALFRIGLYINNHPIVERDFGVTDYNTSARFSKEVLDLVDGIASDIQNHLYKVDINHMWDDYDIINTFGLNIGQIRELSKEKRQNLLRNLNNYDFVKRVRLEYRVNNNSDVEEEVETV